MISGETLNARTLQLAYDELKKYGLDAKLEILEKLPSFEITVKNQAVTIAAPNNVELLYGVYELAEQVGGYMFFEPGDDHYNASRRRSVLPEGVLVAARRPLQAKRGLIQEFPFNTETHALLDWMAKNKMNYLQVWMKYYDELADDMKEMALVRGITIESGHHNFNYWIPGRKYNQTHPEYFAEINGRRIQSSDGKSELLLSEQLCTTNQNLRDEIVKNMLQYLAAHPEVKVISLVPNDGFGWCECPECSKFYDKNEKGDFYSVSAHVYKANRIYHDMLQYVSAKLHAARPDILLTFGAYVNYCTPAPGMKLTPGLCVWLAPYWRCINHLIYDENCPINSHYAHDIQEWCKVKCGGEVLIYEYYMGVNFYLSLPMIHYRDVFKECQWYNKQGVDGVITQFHIPHWSVYGVNYYMMAKACRGDDCEKSIQFMMTGLFGEDAAQAEAFYTHIKTAMQELGGCLIPYPNLLLRRISAETCQQLLDEAKALLAQQPDDNFRKNLVTWMEYLCRFKAIAEANVKHTLTERQLTEFRQWIQAQDGRRLFVQDRFDSYFQAIYDDIKTGKEWLHFNLDWEDAYVKKHLEMWS